MHFQSLPSRSLLGVFHSVVLLLQPLSHLTQAQEVTESIDSLIQVGRAPTLVADGFKFTEGPAADANGNVYFTDIGNNRIHHWKHATNEVSLVRENSGGADGLFVDRDGALWICELRSKRLARLDKNRRHEVILDSFEGESFTGANDLWIDPLGGIYFSDSYAGSQIKHPPEHCVYYIPPGGSELKQIVNDHFKTNGIHVSADRDWIYIADYGGRKVSRYKLIAPGELGEKELFVATRCGGLTVDRLGNVYLSTVDDHKGVLVFNSQGEPLGQIMFPENTTNVTFAGPKRQHLVVTTFKSLYALKMNIAGLH